MLLSFTDPAGAVKHLKLKTMNSTPAITIGRSKEASVTIDDNSASRVHCAIRYWDDMFIVKDMNSRNGTFLNGEQIAVAPLEPGDVLKVGNTEFYAASEAGSSTDVTMAP